MSFWDLLPEHLQQHIIALRDQFIHNDTHNDELDILRLEFVNSF